VKLAERLVLAHVIAVVLAVFSLMVLIPNPDAWHHLPGSGRAYAFALENGGPLHIVLGAAALHATLHASLGARPAWTFLVIACGLSLGMELAGTGTGWPFGNYAYTFGLGPKIFGRVPFAIPLSWYYICASAWVLARQALDRLWPAAPGWAEVALSTWLLTAWDLVLDPAMAHPDQQLSFWVWHTRGEYFGMPAANLAGWLLTGALIVALFKRLCPDAAAASVPTRLPLTVYLVNLAFGAALCLNVGLWTPILLALAAGVVPAMLAWPRAPSAT
jgi:putative membrane protein